MWREERLRGLYRGLRPTVAAYLPNWAVYFWCYDHAKRAFAGAAGSERHLDLVHMAAAVSAGFIATVSTNPLWVIKTRIMVRVCESARPAARP